MKKGRRQIHATISKDLFVRLKESGLLDEEDFDSFVERSIEKELASYEHHDHETGRYS